MSLYKDASLVMIPSAYKDGKLYSIRPTDGSGDFTFSRGSNLAATRVDVNGLIEKGRENHLLHSNEFDTTWANTSSVETGGQADKDGGSSAWLLEKNGANGRIAQFINTSGVQTFSVYAKAGTLDWVSLWTNVGTSYFNLSSGTKGSTTASTTIGSEMESVGNGWYRCSLIFNTTINAVRIYPANGDLDVSGTSGNIYIQDAQLEAGLVATDYIETGASTAQAGILEDMPRLDYSGSCPALLLEPQRTNVVTQSEYTGGYNGINSTQEFNAAVSPEGVQNAVKIVANTTYSQHNRYATISTTGAHTFSVFAKAAEYNFAQLYGGGAVGNRFSVVVDLTDGSIDTYDNITTDQIDIQDYGSGWYRIVVSNFTSASSFSAIAPIKESGLARDAGYDIDYAGDNTSGAYFYGMQVEAGSYPTSYIPTYGSSVTRSADSDGSGVDVSSLVSTNYTCFYEIDPSQFSGGTTWIGQQTSGGACWQVYGGTMIVRTSSGVSYPFGHAAGTRTKVAVVYDGETIYLYKDGAFNSSALADNTRWGNFTNIELSFDNNNLIRYNQVAVFPTALTSSEAIALTTL